MIPRCRTKHRRIFIACSIILSIGAYVGTYLYYRNIKPESVLNYYGNVIRPSFLEFTTNFKSYDIGISEYSVVWGYETLGEGHAGENVASVLSAKLGCDVASPLNAMFYPAMRVDHFFTGSYIRFNKTASRSPYAPVQFLIEIPPTPTTKWR